MADNGNFEKKETLGLYLRNRLSYRDEILRGHAQRQSTSYQKLKMMNF